MTDLKKAAAQQALEALEELNGWQSLAPPLASQAGRQAAINLRATLEQKPKFTLSCGCPSQYAGVPAEWPVTTREGEPATAYGVICGRHWYEYGARCPNCASLEAQNTELDRKLAALEQPDKAEPVAWRTFDGEGGYDYRTYDDNENYRNEWDKRNPNHKGWVEPLYTHPPRREWRGLSKDESLKMWGMRSDGPSNLEIIGFARAIEAALRSKNYE